MSRVVCKKCYSHQHSGYYDECRTCYEEGKKERGKVMLCRRCNRVIEEGESNPCSNCKFQIAAIKNVLKIE